MDSCIATVIMLLFQAVASEFLHNEVVHLGGSCYPRDSCTPTRLEADDNLWGNYTCECGEHCVQYSTCCSNSPHVGKMPHEYPGETCKKVSDFFPQSVVMVSTCSDRWPYEFQIRNKCEKPGGSMEDPLSVVPVMNTATLVSYKNYFCALCNFDNRTDYMWDIALHIETKKNTPVLLNLTKHFLIENLIYNREQESWGMFMSNSSFFKVNLEFKIPTAIRKFVKKCYSNIVTQCDVTHAYNYEVQYKCLSYYSPVKLIENGKSTAKIYRNIHCALCNSVNISDTENISCDIDEESPEMTPKFSTRIHVSGVSGVSGREQLCEKNDIWDPFYKKCRSLVCSVPGYVLRDGKCVKS